MLISRQTGARWLCDQHCPIGARNGRFICAVETRSGTPSSAPARHWFRLKDPAHSRMGDAYRVHRFVHTPATAQTLANASPCTFGRSLSAGCGLSLRRGCGRADAIGSHSERARSNLATAARRQRPRQPDTPVRAAAGGAGWGGAAARSGGNRRVTHPRRSGAERASATHSR